MTSRVVSTQCMLASIITIASTGPLHGRRTQSARLLRGVCFWQNSTDLLSGSSSQDPREHRCSPP